MSEFAKICRLDYEVIQRAIRFKQNEWKVYPRLAVDDPADRRAYLQGVVYPDQGVFLYPGTLTNQVMRASRASVLRRKVSPMHNDAVAHHPAFVALANTLERVVAPLDWEYSHAHFQLRVLYGLETTLAPRVAHVMEQGYAIAALKEKDRANKVMGVLKKQKDIPYGILTMLYAGYSAKDIQRFFSNRSEEVKKIVGKEVRYPSRKTNDDSLLFGNLKLMVDRKEPLGKVVQKLVESNWIDSTHSERYLCLVDWEYVAAEVEFGRAEVWGERYYREHVGEDVGYMEDNIAILSSHIRSFRPLKCDELEQRLNNRKVIV